MIDLKQMICEDCSYPPNFYTVDRPGPRGLSLICVTCRDCGEYWEEPSDADEFFLNDDGTE